MYSIFEKLLNEYGATAYRVSKATGITTSTLTAWKQGEYTPKTDKLQKIAEFFAVSTDYLLGKNKNEIYTVEYLDEYHGINHIGEYLKETRENRGYTIKELSKETGISEKTLAACEDGELTVKSNVFKKILKNYEMTQLDFENEHNILSYEARPEFHGDYNASLKFDKALAHDSAKTASDYATAYTEHERKVISAYRDQPDMQPAVDKILGVSAEPDYRMPVAAHNDNQSEEQLHLMREDLDEL